MAGAAFIRSGARSQSASAATITGTKPAVDGGHGRLLCVVTSKNNAAHATATAGWSIVGAQINSGASFTASLWEADESAAAPVFTWTGAAACSAQVSYYEDGNNPLVAVLAGTNNNGTANPHSTASFNSTRASSSAVLVDVAVANTALTAPAGWTLDVSNGSATDVGRTTFGSKALAASGSASGAVSVSGAAAAWVQWQVELRITAPTALDVTKAEADAWLDPKDGLLVSKAEAGAWLDAKDGFGVSKIEAVAWLDKQTLELTKFEADAWLDPKAGFDVSKFEVVAWLDRGNGRSRRMSLM